MNLTSVIAVTLLVVWAILLFGLHVGSGGVNLLYAAGVLAVARRIIIGAPKFVS